MKIAIVAAPYHAEVKQMIEWTVAEIESSDWAKLADVQEVAGAFEIPLQVSELLSHDGVDAVVTLGAIERGETGHGHVLATAVFSTLIQVSLQHGKPVSLGIIGPNATSEQIASRAKPVAKDALTALRNRGN